LSLSGDFLQIIGRLGGRPKRTVHFQCGLGHV
jgi:hypothetical protein